MQYQKNDTSTRVRMPETKQTGANAGNELPLSINNFILMGASLLLIIIGFALTGGEPSGLEEYNPDIFSTRRIVVGPGMCFVGFVLMAIAIIVKPKQK